MKNFIAKLIASLLFWVLLAVALTWIISFIAWENAFHWDAFRLIVTIGTMFGLLSSNWE